MCLQCLPSDITVHATTKPPLPCDLHSYWLPVSTATHRIRLIGAEWQEGVFRVSLFPSLDLIALAFIEDGGRSRVAGTDGGLSVKMRLFRNTLLWINRPYCLNKALSVVKKWQRPGGCSTNYMATYTSTYTHGELQMWVIWDSVYISRSWPHLV